MEPPKDLAASAADLGFEIVGWDERDGGLRGNGHEYIGTHAEIRAYLRAWETCRDVQRYATAEEIAQAEVSALAKTLIVMRTPMSFTADQTFQVVSRPQVGAFRGERLAMPSELAGRFEILDVMVGIRSQLSMVGPISGEAFAVHVDRQAKLLAEDHRSGQGIRVSISEPALEAWGREWTMETCQIAQDLVVVARSLVEAPQFEFWILGKSLGWRVPR